MIEILKAVFLGIVEGITEWLPISSTGHMLLVNEFLTLNMSGPFKEMFFIVIQLGAIMAVVLIFWKKMWPFSLKENQKIKKEILTLWLKVVIACVPGAIITLLFDDIVEANLHTPFIIAAALVFYGALFIIIEKWNKSKKPGITSLNEITFRLAFLIGMFQALSIIPGTSRSGATIIGALLLGVSRIAAAEFTFFLAVPVMFGMSALKLIKFGFSFTGMESVILLTGMAVAFVVSIIVIKFLLDYIGKHNFKVFGWYRIILGIVVLLFFTIRTYV